MKRASHVIPLPLKRDVCELDYDDIDCFLNPVQAADLRAILLKTLPQRRLNVAYAFTNLTAKELAIRAGVYDGSDHPNTPWRRWLRAEYRMPLGAVFRVAKVFGVPPEVLFQSW